MGDKSARRVMNVDYGKNNSADSSSDNSGEHKGFLKSLFEKWKHHNESDSGEGEKKSGMGSG